MFNPANIEIKTIESIEIEKRKETSHLVFQKHLVVTQQQTMPHKKKSMQKDYNMLNPANMEIKTVESSETWAKRSFLLR